jgi:hypothetical protein
LGRGRMAIFNQSDPSMESCWRGIILFGRNTASYKFALAKTLLEFSERKQSFVTLEELAFPFANHIALHLKQAERQGIFESSKFLDACKGFSEGNIDQNQLIEETVRRGFVNVIDAFHVVNQSPLPERFFIDQRKNRGAKGILLTDNLFLLKECFQFQNLSLEVEARWRLVETAWSLKLPTHLINVGYDHEAEWLYVDQGVHRQPVTSCRDALIGYQKGKCFYCFSDISIEGGTSDLTEVDHFFPHVLKRSPDFSHFNIDGVWNLVLTCQKCNRGEDGKFARVPISRYLERLYNRNTFLIDSHHPLRETLLNQTGSSVIERTQFMQNIDRLAITTLIHRWQANEEYPTAF